MGKIINTSASINKRNFYLYYTFLIAFILIPEIIGEICSSSSKISSSSTIDSCFNEIIKFHGNYRAGQFSIRSDGVLLIEYSSRNKRLFYGLNTNGRGYFNDLTNYIINDIGTSYYWHDNTVYSTMGRYESKNILVKLNDNTNKEYILSVSSYHSLTELHDLDNNAFNIWLTTNFLGVDDEWRYVFSYQFSILNYTNSSSNTYYAAYVQYKSTNYGGKAYSISYSLSKFTFSNLNSRNVFYQEFSDNYDNRIVSAFINTYYSKLMVFYFRDSTNAYTLGIHNLDTLNKERDYTVHSLTGVTLSKGNGIFFKALYLRYNYFAAIFYCDNDGSSLKFRVYYIKDDYSTESREAKYEWSNWGLNPDLTLNEFYKIDDDGERFLFVSTQNSLTKLILFFIDTQDWYSKLSIRIFYYDLDGYTFKCDMAVDYFNNFLMLTSTLSENSEPETFYGALIFFSYPNGTDFYMDLSPYVMNSGYYQRGYNFITFLLSKRTIDNNIFHYTGIDKVKLISIPDEINFYNSSSLNTRLTNNELIDTDGILYENKDLIKYDKNYTLDYQYMAQDQSSYSEMVSQAHEIITSNVDSNSIDYIQKTFYGRVNRLTFRLCHYYCESCAELGNLTDINNQKCLSCLPEYTYDYYYYVKNIFHSNCVPEGYYYDLNTNKLIECTSSNSKFYYNKTDNYKKICFNKDEDCPSEYPILNISNNECTYNFPETTISTTIIPTIPTTIIKTNIPITITTTIPTTLIITIPTTIITTIPSTIITTIPTTRQAVSNDTSILSNNIIEDNLLNNSDNNLNINSSNLSNNIQEYSSEYPFHNITVYNNEEIYQEIINDLLQEYNILEGKEILIKGENNFYYILTTSQNDKNILNGNTNIDNDIPKIDLGYCENILKEYYHIDYNLSLIVLKFEKISNISKEITLQYEVYEPFNKTKLNLSICDNTSISIYSNVVLSDELKQIYTVAK